MIGRGHGVCTVAILTVLLAGTPSHAQRPAQAPAFTNAAEAGPDFAFQGEYSGTVSTPTNQQVAGLQVVALGDGKFQGVYHTGGLPGEACPAGPKIDLEGKRSGDTVQLAGGPYKITLKDGRAKIESSRKDLQILGELATVLRKSPTLGAEPPSNAIVLFDGTGAEQFKNGQITDDGLLMIGTETKDAYTNCTLHVEFRTPFMPLGRGQGRGNSGVYLDGRYEVQILDSFGLEGKDNECGGLYEVKPPSVNMCYPPLAWQTYDIEFRGPKFDADGKKVRSAYITVRHNGVLIQDNVEVPITTRGGRPESPEPLPTMFQDHGNPVRFRNIWLVDHDA